jgi:hypothetical protein
MGSGEGEGLFCDSSLLLLFYPCREKGLLVVSLMIITSQEEICLLLYLGVFIRK